MRIPALAYAAARRLPGARFVDLRSPAEFTRDHVPAAANVPLLDDQQRAVVGALYQQVSPEAALERGLALVEARVPQMLEAILGRGWPETEWRERFQALAGALRRRKLEEVALGPALDGELGPRPVVLYCWRGGLRSRSVAALLRGLGEGDVAVLDGGYKAYRAWVRERLAAFDPRAPLIVLRGPTGVGKTRILHGLEAAVPGSTLDLEGMARHRSSVLGDVGLAPASASAFQSALADRLERMGPPPWFVEGESRRVGEVVLPAALFQAMEDGVQVLLDAPMAHRVAVLRDDYWSAPGAERELSERLPFLEARLGTEWVGRLREWLQEGEWGRVAAVLLERYYDPRYAHHDRRRRFAARLDAADPGVVARLLELRARVQAEPSPGRKEELTPVPCARS